MKKILDEISGYIKNYAEQETKETLDVFCFDSALELLNALEDGKSFDIFVLDVYIGDEMGTSLARNIRKLGIENPIIFATTSIEHAPQGYETAALRYLIKPINPQKIYEAIEAALVQAKKMSNRLLKFKTENGVENRVAVLCEERDTYAFDGMNARILNLGKNEKEMANRLYDLLREAEKICDTLVVIEPREKGGVMVGVLNRLRKACASVDIPHDTQA